ncbi:MAG: hypothetical protein Q9222_000893 [Ikaeria aurantiellina]
MSGMEGDEHERRQYEHQQYPRGFTSGFRSNVPEGSASDRVRQAHLITGRGPNAPSVVTAIGSNAQEIGSFGYPQGPQYPQTHMQSSSLQFSTDYHPDAQRSQNFGQYTSPIVYGVPQQSQPRSPYDAVPQHQARQSTALEVMPNQFGVPQYFNSSEAIAPSGHTATPQQYTLSQYQQASVYQTPGMGRSTISSSYPIDMPEYPPSAMPEAADQQEADPSNLTEKENEYQDALKETFRNTSRGRLKEAGQSLLHISEWLLSNTQELGTTIRHFPSHSPADLYPGLVSDDQSRKEERLKLWNEFNTCWLAVLQRQKDETQRVLDTGQPPPPPQTLLRAEFLETMAETLVQLCDGLEKFGLVDYQMGVWEEEIMSSELH